MMRKFNLGVGIVLWVLALVSSVQARSWDELKGKHFVIFYDSKAGWDVSSAVLRRAEEYYRKIGSQIGYTRYKDFWTWDDRVKIVVFPDQQSFTQNTGQPEWSTGYSDRDSAAFKSKVIITYKQEQEFYDGTLPHEIAHLILHDYVPAENLPFWFDEGVAQLNETSKSPIANQLLKILVRKGKFIDFSDLVKMDIRREKDVHAVKIYYAQCLTVVEFLIKEFGNDAFAELCRNMRDGKPFEEAMRRTYTNSMKSIPDLERKWVDYMMR